MKPHRALIIPSLVTSLVTLLISTAPGEAAPAIRSSPENRVPACASPQRLTSFLLDRNPGLNPRFRNIADWYRYWGEAWRVRWDYAFFQMIVETNALKFRRPDGRYSDVHERQNNFAGIGATGGGVAGDHFPDVRTGVHAQIQHLVAYSGERLAKPVAPRTALKQDDIVEVSRRLARPVTFADLARRWAADRHYAKTIDAVAREFGNRYCTDAALAAPAPRLASQREFSGLAAPLRLGGPDPQKLAGPEAPEAPEEPEVLPWLKPDAATASPAPPASAEPPRPRPAAKHPSAGTIRTIWTRKEGKRKPAEPDAARTADGAQETLNEALPETPKALPEVKSAENSDFPSLPHFKIAPSPVEPSRLGGPVPAIAPPRDASDVEKPRTRFKEILRDPAAQNQNCVVLAASYGGRKTLLVRATADGKTVYTALTVLDGFEQSMFDTYAKASAPDARIVGEYSSRAEALADAHANCPLRN